MIRSLIVAPQWIGDAVMSEPLLARLAQRGERLCVAALPWVAPVYRAMPQVDDIVELPFAHGRLDWSARRRIAGELRSRFDIAYVLPNSIKAALIPWLAGIRRRVGYRGEGRLVLLNHRLPNPDGRPPMVAFYSALAGATSLFDAMALIAGARGIVSNDSGLMHVAAAFGVPQVAVFGSTSPEHTPPLNPNARVLWLKQELQLDCAPCFDRVCRFGHTRCLTGVMPDRVEAALARAVAESVAT